jgi:two-component system LytT family response regulator
VEKISAILIDDEERARNTLSSLLRDYCPDIEVITTCSNVPDGVLAINKHQPQVVFLDIEMPEYSGFELLDFIKEVTFEIIFVTAYSQYAIRAFEVSATDYLLKPVDIDALQKAVEKIKTNQQKSSLSKRIELLKETYQNDEVSRIALPMAEGLLFVEVKDIIVLEADGAYTLVYLKNGSKILVSKKLKFFEILLQSRPLFFRPHRSYIVNINCIKNYNRGENQLIMDNQHLVAISRDMKSEFESLLKELKLLF